MWALHARSKWNEMVENQLMHWLLQQKRNWDNQAYRDMELSRERNILALDFCKFFKLELSANKRVPFIFRSAFESRSQFSFSTSSSSPFCCWSLVEHCSHRWTFSFVETKKKLCNAIQLIMIIWIFRHAKAFGMNKLGMWIWASERWPLRFRMAWHTHEIQTKMLSILTLEWSITYISKNFPLLRLHSRCCCCCCCCRLLTWWTTSQIIVPKVFGAFNFNAFFT